jgi:hypothetical protein
VRNQTGPKEARAGPVTRNCPRPSSRAHGRTPGLPTTGRSRYDRQASPPSLPPSAACTTFSPLATRSSPHLTALLAAWRVRRVRPSRSRRQLFRSGRSRRRSSLPTPALAAALPLPPVTTISTPYYLPFLCLFFDMVFSGGVLSKNPKPRLLRLLPFR